jgi:enoyl-CoA hydratase
LVAASTPAQLAVVRTVDAASDISLDDGLRYEVEQVQELFERGEAAEGLRAFIDKRAPEFV